MKSKTRFLIGGILVLLLVSLMLTACDEKPTKPKPDNTGTVTGFVASYGRAPLAGVSVSIGTKSTTTNSDGLFYLYGINEGSHVLINFSKEDYIPNQKVINVVKGKTTYLDNSLKPALTDSFASTAQHTLVDGLTHITIPENAFVVGSNPFTGNVKAEYKYFDPSMMENVNSFPGSFSGVQADGTETLFESFGYFYASFTSVSHPDVKLQLAPGKKAEVKSWIPIPLLASAPETIKLWHYDEEVGKWFEEGIGTKVGNYYEAEISHFSYWNFDHPITIDDQATITGRVVLAPENTPIAHAQVLATGVTYSGYTFAYTGNDGTFSITVKASSRVRIDVFAGSNAIPAIVYDTPGSGASIDIGDIVMENSSFTLTGRLLLDSGEPFPSQYAIMNLVDAPEGNHFGGWINVDDDGYFMLEDSYMGSETTIKVYVSSTGHGENLGLYSNVVTLNVPQPGQIHNLGTMVMKEGGKIKGRAKDNDGNWISGHWVNFQPENAAGEGSFFGAETDDQGYFTFFGPPNTKIKNVVGTVLLNDQLYETQPVTFNFPASGATTNLGTVVFSPRRK